MHPEGREHEAQPDGRRRDGGRVLAWAPGLTGQAKAQPAAGEPSEEGAAKPSRPDTLGELDFVITPVSVTPPRTWRHAAWFTVGVSCVALAVLVAVSRLAERPFDRIDAFPGLPTGGLLTAQPLGPQAHPPRDTTTDAGSGDSTAPGGGPAGQAGGLPGGSVSGLERDGGYRASTRSEVPAETESGGRSGQEPTVTFKPTTGEPPPVPAGDLAEATTEFYDLLPMDVDEAWTMVGQPVKNRGYESFRKQWGDASEVDLEELFVDADDSSVLATVRLVDLDGTEHVQRYLLSFRKSDSLIIDEITLVSGDEKKPSR